MPVVDLAADLSGGSVETATLSSRLAFGATLSGQSTEASGFTCSYSFGSRLFGTTTQTSNLSVLTGPAVPIRTLTTRSNIINMLVYEQIDLFMLDGITRAQGVPLTALTSKLFYGSEGEPWVLVSGTGVPDEQVVPGYLYWDEFETGYYSIRFKPNVVGIWRLILLCAALNTGVSVTYSVEPVAYPMNTGLQVSFIRGG